MEVISKCYVETNPISINRKPTYPISVSFRHPGQGATSSERRKMRLRSLTGAGLPGTGLKPPCLCSLTLRSGLPDTQ